jgi:hypothetical protein
MVTSDYEGRKKEIRYRFGGTPEGKAQATQKDRDQRKASLQANTYEVSLA